MEAWRARIPWNAAFIVATLIYLATTAGRRIPALIPWPFLDVVVGLWRLCLLVCVAASAGRAGPGAFLRAALSWKPLVFAGTFAYSIYLMHSPLIELIWRFAITPMGLSPMAGGWTLLLFGTPAIIAASYGFFLVTERPFINRYRSPSRKPGRADAGQPAAEPIPATSLEPA